MPEITFDPASGIEPIKKTEVVKDNLQRLSEFYQQLQPVKGAGQYFPNDSRFDVGVQESNLENIENYRGEQQPWYSQAASGIVKGTGLAATTFASAFTSLPYGIVKSAVEGDLSAIYDNEISNTFDKFNKWMEEVAPNYYTEKERTSNAFSWDNLFTTNFLFDKLIKNVGFTVGAIGSGSIIAKSIQGLSKIAMGGKYAEELAKIEQLTSKYINEGVKAEKAFSNAISEIGGGIKFSNAASKYGATLWAAGTEGSMEALGAKQATMTKLIQDYKDSHNGAEPSEYELADMEDAASAAGNVTFGTNLAILSGSDLIQFGKFLRGMKDEKKIIGKLTQEGDRLVNLDRIGLSDRLKPFKGLVTEAAEEGSQTFTQAATKDYYSRKYDNDAIGKTTDAITSVIKGLEETFGTKEGLESMLLGALTGIGSSVVTGGIREDLQKSRQRVAATQAVVDNFNNSNSKVIFDNAVRSQSIIKDMDQAILNNDVYQYKNLKNDLFKSYVQSRIDAGKYDVIEDELEDLKNLPQEEFKDLFGFDITSETNKTINQYVDKLKEEAKSIKEVKKLVDDRFIGQSDAVKEHAFDYISNIQNRTKRLTEIQQTLGKAKVSELDGTINDFINSTDEETRTKAKNNLRDLVEKNKLNFINANIDNPEQLINDAISLFKDRKTYLEKYEKLLTSQGIEELEDKLTKDTNKREEDLKKSSLQTNAAKFTGRGQRIINKETGLEEGRIYKVGDEFRLYKEFQSNGRPVGKYEVVNPSDELFQSTYDVHPEDVSLEGRELSTPESRRLINKLKSFKNSNELVDFINDKIKPLKLANEDLILTEAGKIYKQLTGHELNLANLKVRRIKSNRVSNLEELITRKEKLLANKTNDLRERENKLQSLKGTLNELEQKLAKPDGRTTTNSKLKVLSSINSLQKEIEESESVVSKMLDEQSKLQSNVNFLYQRLATESDITSRPENFDKIIKDIEDEIKYNEGVIVSWKSFINEAKKLLNRLLSFFGMDKIYNENTKEDILREYAREVEDRVKGLPEADRKFGKQMAYALAKVNKLLKDINEGKKEFAVTGTKITQAYNQIESFEKANDELYDKLSYIEEEKAELVDMLRKQTLSKAATPIVNKSNTKDPSKMTDETTVNPSAILTGDTAEGAKNPKDQYPTSSKRTLQNLFRGLAGSHRKKDESLTDDPAQRAYFRFTNKNKLSNGKFFVKLELGDKLNTYNTDTDNQIIKAYFVDKYGKYVDENGNTTTKDKGIHTTLLTSESTYLTYEEDKDKVEEAAKQHLELRRNIISKLQNKEDVTFEVIGKGMGIPRTNTEQFGKDTPTSKVVTKEESKNWTLKVSTVGTITFPDSDEAVKTKNGFTYAKDNETGNTYILQPRKLNDKEISNIVNLFKSFLKNHKQSGDFLEAKGAGIVMTKNKSGKLVPIARTDDPTKLLSVFDVIYNHVFWTGDNLNKEGRKALESAKGREAIEAIYANDDYLINKNDATKFHFIPSEVPGGEIRIGNNILQLFVKDENGRYVPNQLLEEELTNFLKDRYIQIDSILLNDNRGFDKITDISYDTNSDAYIATLDRSVNGVGGYKKSLIDDGVLTTSVIPKGTVENGEEVPQFSNQYAIIDYGEMNQGVKLNEEESKEESKETPKEVEGFIIGKEEIPEDFGYDIEAELEQFEKEASKRSRNRTAYRPAKSVSEKVININEARKFINEAFGGKVSFEVAYKLIHGKNWGLFKNSAIHIYENAEIGTEYHEAFHAVANLFLNNREYNNLIKEYRTKHNDNTSSSNKIEEYIAEDFRDYMLGREVKTLNLTEPTKNFFQKLIDFIKELIYGNPETIQGIFDKLKNNYYADKEFVRTNDKELARERVGNLTILETKNILNGLNFHFFNELFKNKESIASLFDKSDNSKLVESLYSQVKEDLQEDYKDTLEEYKNAVNAEDKLLLEKQAKNIYLSITKNWDQLRNAHREYLKRYKLELESEEKDIIDNIPEGNKTKDSTSLIPTESLKFGSKLNSNKNIKLLIGTLPNVDKNGNWRINDAGVPTNVDFGTTFNLLINKLANLTSWDDMKLVLQDLSEDVPSIKVLLKRLGVDRPYDSLTSDDINQRIQFVQTFAKNNNNFITQKIGENGDIIYFNSNQNSFEKRIKQRWANNLNKLKGSAYYIIDKTGNLQYNVNKFKTIPEIKTKMEALEFLYSLGIQYTNIRKVSEDPNLTHKAQALKQQIIKGNQPIIFSNEEDADVSEDMKYFINLETSTAINNIENSLYNIERELVYGATLNSYITNTINELNNKNVQNKNDLYRRLPHLQYVNSKVIDSLFDKDGNRNDKTIDYNILEGSKETESEVSKSFSDLKIPDKLQNMFNLVLEGKYNILRPADNSIERTLEFGTFFNINDINIDEVHLDTFRDYLSDELQQVKDIAYNGSQWGNLEKNANKGIVLDILKGTDSTLYNELINEAKGARTIDEIINDPNYITSIDQAITEYIDSQKEDVKNLLVKNKIIASNKEGGYTNNGINVKDKEITNNHLDNLLTQYVINSLTGNIEQVKILFGNPSLYKSVEDEFKRHSGAVSTKKISIADEDLNNWITDYLDTESTINQQYVNGEPIIRTAVVDDVKVQSNLFDDYKKIIGNKAESYADVTEGDGQGYIHFDEYRRMLFRAGDWTFGKGSLEEAYQANKGKLTYTDPQSGESFPIDKNRVNGVVFNPLKPQHFGPLAEEGFVMGFYKLSVFPLVPSVIKGTSLETLNNQMELQNTGMVVFGSARARQDN